MSSSLSAEDALILSLAKILPTPKQTTLAIGDDAAVIPLNDEEYLLITTDALMEDVHFRLKWGNSFALGWKSLAQNLSDIAAMGGRPTHAVIALALPTDWPEAEAQQLYRGIAELAKESGTDIIGGDTIRSSGPLAITFTVLGRVAKKELLTRAGAQAGDALFVTGQLGLAAAGLQLLEMENPPPSTFQPALAAQLMPQPRLQAARKLAKSALLTAMMDISDGVATDLHRLCRQSKLGAEVQAALLPLHPLLSEICQTENFPAQQTPETLALYGGEDFELLFTAPAASEDDLRQLIAPLHLTRIGEMTLAAEILLTSENGTEPLAWGFTHF